MAARRAISRARVVAGELPPEGRGSLLVAALEGEQPLFDGSKLEKSLGERHLRWTIDR